MDAVGRSNVAVAVLHDDEELAAAFRSQHDEDGRHKNEPEILPILQSTIITQKKLLTHYIIYSATTAGQCIKLLPISLKNYMSIQIRHIWVEYAGAGWLAACRSCVINDPRKCCWKVSTIVRLKKFWSFKMAIKWHSKRH